MTSSATETPQLRWAAWSEMSASDAHDMLRLRAEVFIVEQNCVYQDIDGLDPACRHLLARDAQGQLLGCLRLLPPGLNRAEPALGRLVVAASARTSGLGRRLMLEGLRICGAAAPTQAVYIHAQQYLQGFYESLGFRQASEIHLEDGIPHIDMLRAAR